MTHVMKDHAPLCIYILIFIKLAFHESCRHVIATVTLQLLYPVIIFLCMTFKLLIIFLSAYVTVVDCVHIVNLTCSNCNKIINSIMLHLLYRLPIQYS